MSDLLSPAELERHIRELCQDALAIYPMYRRLHGMGLEPRRGDTVHVSGGGESNTPARLAVDSDYAASRRDYARWVAGEIEKVSRRVDRVRQGLERNVGPTPGFRQPKDTGNGRTKVTADELTVSLLYQGIRLRRGAE